MQHIVAPIDASMCIHSTCTFTVKWNMFDNVIYLAVTRPRADHACFGLTSMIMRETLPHH